MFLTLSSVVLALFTMVTPGLSQSPIVLDPATVPCNWHGDPDIDWLYVSTSTIVLNRTLIMSGNFTYQGGAYDDGISCDPALFFLSQNVSHLTNVSLWNHKADDSFLADSISELPSELTMLNWTFGGRMSINSSPVHNLKRFFRLQSLALRGAPRDVSGELLDSLIYQEMMELLILDLSYNNIVVLNHGIFDFMYNLTIILLNGNPIHSTEHCGFNMDTMPLLCSVNLVDAQTNFIVESIFSSTEPDAYDYARYKKDLKYLNILRLSKIDSKCNLKPFAFSRLKSMTELQVSGAGVTGIDDDTFACLKEMKNLFLFDNKIQNLSLQTFRHLDSLQQLLLSNNSLNNMSAMVFKLNPLLVYLNASYNMIESLEGPFSITPRISYLDFSHNRIKRIQNNTFSYCLKLERLFLQYNNLTSIESGAFLSVHKLQILNLAHNRLVYVSQPVFADMSSLSEMYLNDNLFTHIESGVFLSLERLDTLNLAHNRLSSVCKDLFSAMTLLRELYLNDNLLQYMDANTVPVHSATFSGVSLGGNPWDCNCKLDPLRLWLKMYGNITLDLQEVTCFETKGIIAFSDSFCQIQSFHVVGIVTALLCVMVAGNLTLYRFRLDIQLLLFAKYGLRLPWKWRPHTDDQNRTYDAFVSYNSSDQTFVLRELMPKLERQPPFYKLCLHFRDFALGAAVAENIVEAIDTSKRTIMLLSKDLLQSNWCQYEFQMAHHQVLSEGGRNRLILIMMERIDASDIADRTLKSYIRTHTYIERNDPRFWERLRFALPDKKDTADQSAAQKHG